MRSMISIILQVKEKMSKQRTGSIVMVPSYSSPSDDLSECILRIKREIDESFCVPFFILKGEEEKFDPIESRFEILDL